MKIFKIKNRTIAGLILILLFASCVTQKQRAKICNACAIATNSKDSVWEHLVHDTLKLAPIPGPIQYLENPCAELCDSLGRLKAFIHTETKNGITGTIRSVGNSIAFNCDADSLQAVIDHIEKESFHKQQDSYVKYITCSLEHRTRFDGFTYWWFWITFSILVLYILIKICKTYLKRYLPFLK